MILNPSEVTLYGLLAIYVHERLLNDTFINSLATESIKSI